MLDRQQTLSRLHPDEPYDLLVIGGGATGCGIALDAATRGLRVALAEKNDLGEGTSSRSTKLVHGGVRYLELAVKHLDWTQYHLVRDALHERGLLLLNAPHLCDRLPLVTPLYKWAQVPYIYAGLKIYDVLAGSLGIGHSRLLGRKEALERFPMLKAEGLKAGVLYYDGQFNDARMVVALALTAREHGAVVANHLEAVGLVKENGRVAGARVRDFFSGEEREVRARAVVNATGPFADRIRRLDDASVEPMLQASSGIHILLDKRFAPPHTGLLIPKTEDGRVLFVLPWEGHALVGTTDEPADITEHPRPREEEIAYLLRHLGRYFDLQVTEDDIKAGWSGLRPLVSDPKAADTAQLARDHVLEASPSGLLTIAGGKWTTYRKMALDVVDYVVRDRGLDQAGPCRTERLPVVGAAAYEPDGDKGLAEAYGLDDDVAHHLNRAYGDQAPAVARLATGRLGERLHPEHPFLEAEVVYALRNEMAMRIMDILARRIPLAQLDRQAAQEALPRVLDLAAEEMGWDKPRRVAEAETAAERLAVAL